MTRKHSFSRLFAFFLLLALLVCSLSSFPLSAAESNLYLEAYAAEIDLMLSAALQGKATALEAEGDAESASLLRGFSFHAHRIAIVDFYYSQTYVKVYKGAAEVATEMIDFLVENFYLDQLTTPELVTDALVLCYTRAVDDVYASYANEETYVAPEDEETEYVGIGVTVELLADGYAKVIEVASGSPAEGAGMRLGDILIAVEGEDFALLGYDNAINRIRGEEGTEVTVTVRRGEASIDFTMKRKKLAIRSVSFRMLAESEEKIGYIRITKFDGTTFAQFVEAIETLEQEGAASFVFDVRQNPGGRLDVVVAMLDYILPDGTGFPIVRLQYRNTTESIEGIADYFSGSESMAKVYGYSKALNHSIDKKMTVLCDAYTVSAAELFTSCLKDFGLAEVFGSTTYGKGMGQSELTIPYSYEGEPLQDGDPISCIRVSTFYYSPPVSDNYEGVGVTPHHAVSLSEELINAPLSDLTYSTDLPLQAAVAFLESDTPNTEGQVQPPADSDNSSGADKEASHKLIYTVCFGVVFVVFITAFVALFAIGVQKRRSENLDPDETNTKAPPTDDETH